MSDSLMDAPVEDTQPNEPVIDENKTAGVEPDAPEATDAEPEAASDEMPEWLLPKYLAGGKTKEQAMEAQAKAYLDAQKKIGAVSGAPEAYELSIDPEIGVEFDTESTFMQEMNNTFKELNVSQEAYQKIMGKYAEVVAAEQQLQAERIAEQKANALKELGKDADYRLKAIRDWGASKLDAETFEQLKGMVTTAESVKVLETIMGMTRNAPQVAKDTPVAPSVTMEQIKELQFAKDEFGNRKMQDPAYRRMVEAKLKELTGGADYKQVVG